MLNIKQGLTFDDVLLQPCYSTIGSRFSGEIDLTPTWVKNLPEDHPAKSIKHPIISSNMDTITDQKMANKISQLGGLGIIHRFMSIEEHFQQLYNTQGFKVACVGVNEESVKRFEYLYSLADAWLIDVAHGDSSNLLRMLRHIVDNDKKNRPVIAGNVATYEGARRLFSNGATFVKVGIGSSQICSTRLNTGNGVPQLTAIDECSEAAKEFNGQIIADGGIRHPGDVVKALAAGANFVMLGGYFSGVEETPGGFITIGKNRFKVYRGMASEAVQSTWKGFTTSVEGVSVSIPFKGPLEGIYNNLINNILSGFSYQNARNVEELRENCVFVQQTQNGVKESSTFAE